MTECEPCPSVVTSGVRWCPVMWAKPVIPEARRAVRVWTNWSTSFPHHSHTGLFGILGDLPTVGIPVILISWVRKPVVVFS